MQDDTENGGGRVGMLRPGADTNAECRDAESGSDQRVPEAERRHRVCGPKPVRDLRLGAACSGGPRVRGAGQETKGRRSGVPEQGDGIERAPNGAADRDVPGERSGGTEAVPAARVHPQVHGAGRSFAGGSGSGARVFERAGDTLDTETGMRAVRQGGVCAAGPDLGGASVQSAQERILSQAGRGVRADAAEPGVDRRAPPAGPARAAGVSARGHRASRRLGRSQGGVPHQCGRQCDAMAGSGLREQDQRAVSDPGAASDAASVSVSHSGFSCGQRLGIHQSHGGRAAGETAGGVHQEPRQPHPGQRFGGRQKRSRHSQAHRLWTYCRRTCRAAAEVLHGALEPVLELASSVRVCDGEFRCAGQAQTAVQGGGLSDPVREAEVVAGGGEILKAGAELRATGAACDAEERHRMRPADGAGEGQAAAVLQTGIASTTAVPVTTAGQGCGNDGAVERVENQKQVSHPFHRPLEISQRARDSHIPTAPAILIGLRENRGTGKNCGPWKSGNPKAEFPLSHRPDSLRRKEGDRFEQAPEGAERKPVSAAARLRFQYHLALETKDDFSIILRLENAA